MNIQNVFDLAYQALWISVLISGPFLVVTAVVGVIISVLQAVTSIQDATLTFVPKVVAGAAVAILFGGWMTERMISFATYIFGNLDKFM